MPHWYSTGCLIVCVVQSWRTCAGHGMGPAWWTTGRIVSRRVNTHFVWLIITANLSTLLVSLTRRLTIGNCAFPVTVAQPWSGLASAFHDAMTPSTLCQCLKPYLYPYPLHYLWLITLTDHFCFFVWEMVEKNCDFWPLSHHTSEIVQDMTKVAVEC